MKSALVRTYGKNLLRTRQDFAHLEPDLLVSDAHDEINVLNSVFFEQSDRQAVNSRLPSRWC